MFSSKNFVRLVAAVTIVGLIVVWLSDWDRLPPPIDRDFERILERDTLVMLTTYNSTSYFLYRGRPLGFEYELLRRFASDHDLHLKVRVLASRDSIFHLLNLGKGDIVGDRVVPKAADTVNIAFTTALYRTQPVLVQRKPRERNIHLPEGLDTVLEKSEAPGARGLASEDDTLFGPTATIAARVIRNPADLADEEVALRNRSPYAETLMELTDTLTGDITIVEIDTAVSDETLIRAVARGIFDYTVTSKNLADLKGSYYTNLQVRPVLGPPHRISWAIRRNATELKRKLNAWIEEHRKGRFFNVLYNRYFVDRKGYRERVSSDYLTSETGRLSPYDEILQRGATEIGWDWRLLAAQAYQESRFNPNARSWAGARGLLQLMPSTARRFGVTNLFDPSENVEGASHFLSWLDQYWIDKIPNEEERRKFVLASYNVGQGHVQDARRLTRKYGGDDTVWADVAYWMMQKSKRQYYQDPVVRHGFARGLEPVLYVSRVLGRFDHYRTYVTETEALASTTS